MLNRHRHGVRIFAYYLSELVVLSGAFFAAYWLRQKTSDLWGPSLGELDAYVWLWPISLVVWSGLLWGFNAYLAFRTRTLLRHGFTLGVVCALGVLALYALLTILKEYTVNRSFIGVFGAVAFFSLLGGRILGMAFLSHYTQKGYDRHYVLIGGTGGAALSLAHSMEEVRGSIYQVRGFVSQDAADVGKALDRWKVLGTFDQVPALASQEPVDEVYLLPGAGAIEDQRALVEQCESMGVDVYLRLAPFEKMLSRPQVSHVGGASFLTFTTAPRSEVPLAFKRGIDLAGALLGLAILSPVLLVVAVLVRLTSRGSAIFRQERAGMNGRAFTLYKFRTMREGAEKERGALESRNEMDGPVFKIRDDPRVTGLGRFLRRTSLDELPQLWNVLTGDMSLVGPRPLPVYEVEKFERGQRRRMTMRPGITCLWQVEGRNRVSSFTEWMRLDLEYVDQWSLGLDLRILIKTVPAVLGGRGAC